MWVVVAEVRGVWLVLVGVLCFAVLATEPLEGLLEAALLGFYLVIVGLLLALDFLVEGLLLLVHFLHLLRHLSDGVCVVLCSSFLGPDRALDEIHPCSPAFVTCPELLLELLPLC